MADFATFCAHKRLNIGFFSVGDFIRRIAAESQVNFTEKVLDSDPAVLSLARRTAFYEIAQLAKDYQHTVVGLHACFRWHGSLLEGFSFKDIEIIQPDMLINIVDNIADISERMEGTLQWSGMGKAALNVWLDEEKFLTRQLAHLIEKPYYTVAKQHDLKNFHDLLFSPKKPVFYLSYPITLLTDTPEEIEKIREMAEKLSCSFIVFDPLSVKDMALVTTGGEVVDSTQRVATVDAMDKDIIEQIKTCAIFWDYQFIHQSDFIVVIYPTDKLSAGVLSKMNYASRHNKPVYALYTGARSIFFEKLCDRIFDTFEELVDFLNTTYHTLKVPQ